jgi:hypothetical protein
MATVTVTVESLERQKRSLLRAATTFPAAVGFLLAAGVFATTRGHLAEPDIFWHLRNAQYVSTHLRIVTNDMYSFTVAGLPWVSHEWLSELAYYGAYQALGWQGVTALFCALTMAMVVGVYWLARREGAEPLVAGVAAASGQSMIMVGAGPRMQHFGWLCFIAVYAILQKYRADRRAPLWALPPLFCLWINLHGSWLSGAAVCLVLVLSGLIRRDLGRIESSPWTWIEFKRLAIVGAASVAALFVNPTGYHAVLYPVQVMTRMPLQQQYIQEWQAANFAGPFGIRMMFALAVVFLIAVMGKKHWRADEVLLAMFVLYFGLVHERLLILTGIVLPVILARHITIPTAYDPSHERRKLNFAVCCASILAIVVLFPSSARLQSEINKDYPAAATAYIRSHRLTGRIFNNYQWGGYLEWFLPEQKTFIDGRGDIFEFHGVLKDYLDATSLHQSKEILDRYRIDYVLIETDSALAYLLDNTSGWRRTYKDDQSVIFKRTAELAGR